MKKANIPLILGTIILLFIVVVMVFPDLFATRSPYDIQKVRFVYEDGQREVLRAPFAPSPDFILGSDDMGRDILSQIVYGTRLTILLGFLVALGRFALALPFALLAGFGHAGAKAFIRQTSIIFSAIPALLISVIILRLDFFMDLDKAHSITAFVILLSLVGWSKLGSLLSERIAVINAQPFIRGEIAIGKSAFKIALENIVPYLIPETLVLFFMEIARALSMVMQLGIFSVFVGNLRIIKDTEGGMSFYNFSFEPEWAGMLSTSRNMIRVAPWAVIYPALAFFISVLGFNLFGEGLRSTLQKKNSAVIPVFRKLISFDIKGFWQRYSIKAKVLTGALIALFAAALILPNTLSNVKYRFEITPTDTFEAQTVMIGTPESAETADLLAQEMTALALRLCGTTALK